MTEYELEEREKLFYAEMYNQHEMYTHDDLWAEMIYESDIKKLAERTVE